MLRPTTQKEAYQQGYFAAKYRSGSDKNPYDSDSELYASYENGYNARMLEELYGNVSIAY